VEINQIIKCRKIIASAKGNIGLFWMNKDLNDVLEAEMITVQDCAAVSVDICEWLSVQKTHEQAFRDFPADEILKRGGDPKNYRSLPRGFVAFSVDKDIFYIVGGDWLAAHSVIETIKKVFELTGTNIKTTINSDYNIGEACF
jgi:hypothetical protein